MRDEWLLDRDLLKLRQMIYKPEKYLKSEASNYKAYELYMEEQFWNSKVNTEIYSYYD